MRCSVRLSGPRLCIPVCPGGPPRARCPVSSCGSMILVEEALERSVLVGIVGAGICQQCQITYSHARARIRTA
jgi:hypothetical protein